MQLIVLEEKKWWAAAIEIENRITDIWAEQIDMGKPGHGDLILGKVSAVLDGKNAAFVSLGRGKPGLLNGDELVVSQRQKTVGKSKPAVSDCLEEGQPVLVQVKYPGADRKGPILTELITFTGEKLVYMPYAGYSGVSKQLTAKRERLLSFAEQRCIEQEGLIFRTSSGQANDVQLNRELETHRAEFNRLLEMSTGMLPPALLKKGKGLSEQVSNLFPLHHVTGFISNSPDALTAFMPYLPKQVEVSLPPHHQKKTGKLKETLASLQQQTVKIAKANLHIEETKAVTAIDVDSGGADFGSKRETHYAVNIAAIDEIARQIRLRNIGGMIVIDFLRVEREDQAILFELMKSKETNDPRLQVVGFTKLGLFELQRKKAGLPLSKITRNDE
ncbi:ribonuclease E/G [Pseudalkalibacillus hwajinpoensis]|uniref:ribonuclease E/G n=1 Tax=Guptibacillus hwajinpoensis TaxID=208199 RepID=UPI00325B3EDF